ncbi:D-3-phosphoglycerate dehydrogenase [Pseudoclavibacter endophyticus]|uniref:Phosphoglycerate dehydrogenase n=1 Tax=Pseudoclavibacter endophyticus TaxID=1778590 RepID=A0A6H9WPM2_9MICO|nr:phosphoglycerate dehydrogenase [Pseudoclavibacter endophyticus]KAB1648785.1 phosphoglycerate dehydrogenase [Pseudoclavibacter endophyticus]GGA68520.1 D-3-phosphoglycerate dehydrogenase [Pseudoclavibacter endophyticus]
MKALLLENIHSDAEALLRSRGFEIETRKGALDTAELIEALDGVSVLGIRSKTQLTREVFEGAPGLAAVGAFSIGTNQIDLAAASDHAVACFNAPYSNTRSVVELAIGEIIMMARRLSEKNAALHDGIWDKSATGAHEVRGRTLGIVGYGNIGSQLSVVAESLGMRVYFYDIVDRLVLGNAQRCNSLEELLETVETVTLHVDGRASNTGMFGAEQFAKMRPRSLFLNLSRGHLVDLDALADALRSGHIAGAAVDVFPHEPKKQGDPFTNVLQGIPNVILTPHIGGSTAEAQKDIGHFVAGKLADYMGAGSTNLSVNFPTVQLEPVEHGVRLLHLNQNVPGVLVKVNAVFGSKGVNIDAQQYVTRDHLGYAVTDVSGLTRSVVREILALPETIRLSTIGTVEEDA